MNEVDDLSDDEKRFLLYWLKAKKNVKAAIKADSTIKPNKIKPADIYKQCNNARKQTFSLFILFKFPAVTFFAFSIKFRTHK
jgi:hypothetical protein